MSVSGASGIIKMKIDVGIEALLSMMGGGERKDGEGGLADIYISKSLASSMSSGIALSRCSGGNAFWRLA